MFQDAFLDIAHFSAASAMGFSRCSYQLRWKRAFWKECFPNLLLVLPILSPEYAVWSSQRSFSCQQKLDDFNETLEPILWQTQMLHFSTSLICQHHIPFSTPHFRERVDFTPSSHLCLLLIWKELGLIVPDLIFLLSRVASFRIPNEAVAISKART